MFRVGKVVFYPGCGPCSVAGVAARASSCESTLFYHLVVLGDQGDVFVPVERAAALGLRALLTRADVPALLEGLRESANPAADWRVRNRENHSRLASGSAFDLAEIVRSLVMLGDTHELSFTDRRILMRARELLIDELANVTGATKSAAEARIDLILEERSRGERARKQAPAASAEEQ
jgi:CarD family transcriptional regulator